MMKVAQEPALIHNQLMPSLITAAHSDLPGGYEKDSVLTSTCKPLVLLLTFRTQGCGWLFRGAYFDQIKLPNAHSPLISSVMLLFSIEVYFRFVCLLYTKFEWWNIC